MKIMAVAAAAGLVFGALTSLANVLSSPYGEIGARFAGSALAETSKVLSLLLDAGWSWAALAVMVGWVAGTRIRAAFCGVVALTVATVSYYVMDVYLWDAGTDMVDWLIAGVPLGLILGLIGALIRRPGLTGLAAALTVPVGAVAQVLVIPPGEGFVDARPTVVAADIVWAGAALAIACALLRFRRQCRADSTA